VLKGVQPHEIPFSTSVFARNSVVELSNNMKTSCALHVITKYGTIFFASTALQQVLYYWAYQKTTINQCWKVFNHMKSLSVHLYLQEIQWLNLVITWKHHVLYMFLLNMVQYISPVALQQPLLSISKTTIILMFLLIKASKISSNTPYSKIV
jgi:hypothetical protein